MAGRILAGFTLALLLSCSTLTAFAGCNDELVASGARVVTVRDTPGYGPPIKNTLSVPIFVNLNVMAADHSYASLHRAPDLGGQCPSAYLWNGTACQPDGGDPMTGWKWVAALDADQCQWCNGYPGASVSTLVPAGWWYRAFKGSWAGGDPADAPARHAAAIAKLYECPLQ